MGTFDSPGLLSGRGGLCLERQRINMENLWTPIGTVHMVTTLNMCGGCPDFYPGGSDGRGGGGCDGWMDTTDP